MPLNDFGWVPLPTPEEKRPSKSPIHEGTEAPPLLGGSHDDASIRLQTQICIYQLPEVKLQERIVPPEPQRTGWIEEEPPVAPNHSWDPILISLVRKAMPNLIAYDICGVQPMVGPSGLIFAMRSKYEKEGYNSTDKNITTEEKSSLYKESEWRYRDPEVRYVNSAMRKKEAEQRQIEREEMRLIWNGHGVSPMTAPSKEIFEMRKQAEEEKRTSPEELMELLKKPRGKVGDVLILESKETPLYEAKLPLTFEEMKRKWEAVINGELEQFTKIKREIYGTEER